jgi:hypothetical protein
MPASQDRSGDAGKHGSADGDRGEGGPGAAAWGVEAPLQRTDGRSESGDRVEPARIAQKGVHGVPGQQADGVGRDTTVLARPPGTF